MKVAGRLTISSLLEAERTFRTDPGSLSDDRDLREIIGGGRRTHDHVLVGGGEDLRTDPGSLSDDRDLREILGGGRKTHDHILVGGGEDLRTDLESLGDDGDLRQILGGGREIHDHILVGGGEVERRRDPRPTPVQSAYRPSQESVMA